MYLRISMSVIMAMLLTVPAAAQEAPDPEQDFKTTMDAYNAAKTDEEKFVLWFAFLERNPNGKYTVGTVNYLANAYYKDHLNDPQGAVEFINGRLEKLEDEEKRLALKKTAFRLYGDAGNAEKVEELAGQIWKGENLKYTEHMEIIETALKAEAWDFAVRHSDAAMPLANAETFRSDYPEEDFSDEWIETAGRNRVGLMLGYKGWALANLGSSDEAMAAFGKAEKTTRRNYLGFPDSDLYLYWGRTLLEQGDLDGAIEKFAPGAVMLGQKKAAAGLREAYISKNGSDEGLDDLIWKKRGKLARTVDDFTLPDYEGNSQEFSALRGKVTLLAFWFPT